MLLVLRPRDELPDLQELTDVRSVPRQGQTPRRLDIGPAHADDLHQLNPLVLLPLDELALLQELRDVLRRSGQRRPARLLHTGPARIDHLGDPDPLILLERVLPAVVQEVLQFVGGPGQRLTGRGQQFGASHRSDLRRAHAAVLEGQFLRRGEKRLDVGVAAGQRGLGSRSDTRAARLPEVDRQTAIGRVRLGERTDPGGRSVFPGHCGRGSQETQRERHRHHSQSG
ncbi:hypothetical protein A3Q37_04528 [Streptomyces sp. PTY087I2]|nr:hypothetical protein A3Q37_04528 [Streptomyces sp. PTY087I2]